MSSALRVVRSGSENTDGRTDAAYETNGNRSSANGTKNQSTLMGRATLMTRTMSQAAKTAARNSRPRSSQSSRMMANGSVDEEDACSASRRRTIAGVAFDRCAIVLTFSSTNSGSRIAGRQNSVKVTIKVAMAPQNQVQM